MAIEKGDRVTFRYQVFAEGGLVDASEKPVHIRVGEGRFPPSVERAFLGREKGARFSVWVPPEEHYGRYDPKKVRFLPSEKIPSQVRIGETVLVQDEFGVLHPARLARRDRNIAVVDLNHPLAGKYLRFDIEILEVEKEDLHPEVQHSEVAEPSEERREL
ncbi:MAG TPA: hypothetical protein ENJ40_07075 [Thermosulfurimonas dismutans]|uniref:Peptidyl-prolyl cis-trans isomerase n=1 Tax=Thermosulfurimonas dismutans TaxID=999894 RepID=A0A7C3GRU6_9BACT|nr:hypothetical protein [Thermosulfurimonas dismutans]